ncbi:carbohydrate-binding protein SusD [Flavivirga aquatica]|uniref:Carbohydrate-binding protein SusD n=1 Tax=Flavivirga aquatica TaxID=1849968 RepID=A0A1E5SIT7_9FLAO|nr:RagB/SusD family nutrient uptake outer membrane protein [Flavivirga aquatica]OEJ99032.1 carbohydrate-binding protein SusD [Flavivirga aquatica]
MKRIKNISILFTTLLFVSVAFLNCEEVLEPDDRSGFTGVAVFNNIELADLVVASAYNSTGSWGLTRRRFWPRYVNLEQISFEARFNFRNLDRFRIKAGWNSNNVGDFFGTWRDYFAYVRDIGGFLSQIDDSSVMQSNPEEAAILKGEMQFLMGNTYFQLINYFGGVPILDEPIAFLEGDFVRSRDSYEDCVDFIVANLDAAIAALPEARPNEEFGRATKLSAMAAKSRVLLYAASRLHDPSTTPSGPLYDYTKGTKWQDAADAAKDLIDAVNARDLTPVSTAKDYQDLFLTESNPDILFARAFGNVLYDNSALAATLPNQALGPKGDEGWGLSTPTHNFVQLFNMADGTTTSEAGTSYDPSVPNDNRELRYYADILYNGAPFRGRNIEYFKSTIDGDSGNNGLDTDDTSKPGNFRHFSKTAYNIRKFQDESVGVADISPDRPFIIYRLAEIYLNYAEAMYHVGDEVEARTFLNKVSTRAMQPEITKSGAELLEAIKRERRIELCFERHNFFDERRWMNEAHLGGYDEKGLQWTKQVDGSLTFEIVDADPNNPTRPFFERHYYLPIPQAEIDRVGVDVFDQNFGY